MPACLPGYRHALLRERSVRRRAIRCWFFHYRMEWGVGLAMERNILEISVSFSVVNSGPSRDCGAVSPLCIWSYYTALDPKKLLVGGDRDDGHSPVRARIMYLSDYTEIIGF